MNHQTHLLTIALTALLLGAVSSVSFAQPMGPMGPGPRGPMMSFESFDLNGDGAVTEQEFEQARAQRIAERSQQGYMMRNLHNAPSFAEFDLNGDGQMTPDEFATVHGGMRQQRMPMR